jgi:hypothetical protein
MPSWKKVIISGSNAALNSLTVTNGITGSLLGTSSFASNTNETLATVTARGASTSTATTFNADVTLGNTADLIFSDLAGTYPTSGKGFDWTLNNDGARIYAIQPASDSIDFVFQLRDNATTNDRFVFWVDDYTGPSGDKYPLIMRGGTEFDLVDSSLYVSGTLRLSNAGVLQNVTGNISMFTNNSGYVTSATAFIQNGNSFGATALLGTNDNQSLALETNGTTRMFISSSGNIGIGTGFTSAAYPLHVSASVSNVSIYASNDIVAFSDQSVKENIRPIENVIERIGDSRGVLYDRIDNGEKDNIGFIAQELEVAFPELVVTNSDGTKAVKYQNAVAVLFEAIKEQQKQIDSILKLLDK